MAIEVLSDINIPSATVRNLKTTINDNRLYIDTQEKWNGINWGQFGIDYSVIELMCDIEFGNPHNEYFIPKGVW